MKLAFSKAVARALRDRRPVVALESSVLAQGLAWPQNLECAKRCEQAVRDAGAIPATIAVLDGAITVGLDEPQVLRLCRGAGLLKLSSRDLAPAITLRSTGGTTVSATVGVAAAAGIRVFATGGIGGVHRGVLEHFDVSQDLAAIARHPVAVVCAGAKVVLDLPRTLEVLESLGVPVVGFCTDVLPAFYARTSGLTLEHRVDSVEAAADLVRARFDALGQGGLVLAVPPPVDTALDRGTVERHLKGALAAARKARVTGKAVTPFLLGELARRTRGQSVVANLALLENNARVAGTIAAALRGAR